MEKINFNIMSFRLRSRENNSCKKCFKVKVNRGVLRETVEYILQQETPYKIDRPNRREIEEIKEVFTVEEALTYVETLQFTVPEKVTIESKYLINVDSFYYDPGFRINYIPYYNISFFNKNDKEFYKNLINVPNCTLCKTGNYKSDGEYKLLRKEKNGIKVWNLYYVIHCTETITENKVLKY